MDKMSTEDQSGVWYFGPEPWDFGELFEAFRQAPYYHIAVEVILILFIIRLLFSKSYPIESKLTKEEEETLIEEWKPEPLVPKTPQDHPALNYRVVTQQGGSMITVDGKQGLNLGTYNFLGMVGRKETEEAALKTLSKYGVGSCGPRGFYGTFDVHLEFEEQMAQFMCVEEVILYAYGFSTVASAIPAYAKRGDLIFCDEGVSFSIQMGLLASRSKVKFFKHNDMADLERILEEQAKDDQKNPKKAQKTRKFMIVEGLYTNYGDIVDIKKLIELKFKYKVRIFMDESVSFGVLGKTGKGVTEHFDVDITDIDLITVSLEMAMGTLGGFCMGSKYIVDHQRLSGLGYCFSASLPPMLATPALVAVDLIKQNPSMLQDLRKKCQFAHRELAKIEGMKVQGVDISPIQHLILAKPGERDADMRVLQSIVSEALDNGVVLTVARYLDEEEAFPPPPSIRVAVSIALTDAQLSTAIKTLQEAASACLQQIS